MQLHTITGKGSRMIVGRCSLIQMVGKRNVFGNTFLTENEEGGEEMKRENKERGREGDRERMKDKNEG